MPTLNENIHQAIDDFDNIKSAIIEKGVAVPSGTSTSEYGEKIKEIETGITPTGTIDITENGSHDVTAYEFADVNVAGLETIENIDNYTVSRYEIVPAGVDEHRPDGDVKPLYLPSGENVNTIGARCCFANSNISGVYISNNYTEIANGELYRNYSFYSPASGAFMNCKNMRRVYGGARLATIGSNSFALCEKLIDIDWGSDCLENIRAYAFYGCTNFNKGNFDLRAIRQIGNRAFSHTGVTKVKVIVDHECIFDESCFAYCDSINKIILSGKGNGLINLYGRKTFFNSHLVLDTLALLGNFSGQYSQGVFGAASMTIENFYTDLSETDFNNFVAALQDSVLKTAIQNATNKVFEYSGDGSEL